MSSDPMPPYAEWEQNPNASRAGDPLWTLQAYRLSLYAVECHTADRRTFKPLAKSPVFDQLTRALGSIAANIAEGYSRSTGADRTRFYGYALGSTRESIVWYDSLSVELGDLVVLRQDPLIRIRRLLLTTLRNARPKQGA